MRKSDVEEKSEQADVVHHQYKSTFDRYLFFAILGLGVFRILFALGVMWKGYLAKPDIFYAPTINDKLIHTFAFDFNYSAGLNFILGCVLVVMVLMLFKSNVWGFRLFIGMVLFMILFALPELGEWEMLYQCYYWIWSFVLITIISWRKGFIV